MKSICLSLASAVKDIPPPPKVWSTVSSQLYQLHSLSLPTDMTNATLAYIEMSVKTNLSAKKLDVSYTHFAKLTWGINWK